MTKRIPTDAPDALLHRPFAGLGGVSSAAEPKAPPAPEPPPRSESRSAPAWAVVRLERKGRGGKEVTVIDKLELRASALERWARSLKQDLGCGGLVDGRAIVPQGDQRDRAVTWLETQGVRKVTRG